MAQSQTLQFPIHASLNGWLKHQGVIFAIVLAPSIAIAYLLPARLNTPLKFHNLDLGFVFGVMGFTLFVFFLTSASSAADITIDKTKVTVTSIPLIGLSPKTTVYKMSELDGIKTFFSYSYGRGSGLKLLLSFYGKNVKNIWFELPTDGCEEADVENYAQQLAALLKLKVTKYARD